MTAAAVGKGALALRRWLRRRRHKRMVERGDAVEITTPGGETVIYKPAGWDAHRRDAAGGANGVKPHQDKPSRMGLA